MQMFLFVQFSFCFIHLCVCHLTDSLTLCCDTQDGRFLGVDIDDGQLQKASENVEFSGLGHRIHLLKASSMSKKP